MKRKILLVALLAVGLMGVSALSEGIALDFGMELEGPLPLGVPYMMGYSPVDYMFQVGAKLPVDDTTIAGGIAIGTVQGQGPCWGVYGKLANTLRNFLNFQLNLEGTMLFSWRSNWDMCNSGLQYSAVKAWISHLDLPVYVGAKIATTNYVYDLMIEYGPFVGASLLCGPIQLYGELVWMTEYHPYWYSGQWSQLNFNVGVKIPL